METVPGSSSPPSGRVLLAVGLFAGATLGLQVGFTRQFSYLYWHHFAFMIIGIGMLGFGAAGAWLARGGGVAAGEVGIRLAPAAGLAAAAGVVVYLALGPWLDFAPLRLLEDPKQFGLLFAIYLLVLAPFTALGFAQGAIVSAYRAHAHRVYGADLLGAGLGCLGMLALLSVTSVPTALMVLGGIAALAGGLVAHQSGLAMRLAPIAVGALMVALAFGGWGDARGFLPAPSKVVRQVIQLGPNFVDYTRQSATLRIDVTRPHSAMFGFGGDVAWPDPQRVPRVLTRKVYQDGAAPTALFRVEDPKQAEFLGRTNQGLAYQIRRDPDVCIIGAGGGPDVLIALHHGAASVTAVELNPQMLELGVERYRDFIGGLFQRDEVQPIVAEGRHFLARSERTFDIIQMSGVDTFAALASGAYAMSENYLYTVEAGQAVLRRLAPDGVLTNSRWFLDPPRETLRLVGVFAEALRREGIEDPAQHLFAIRAQHWGTTLVSKRPFQAEELEILRAWTAELGWEVVLDPNGGGLEPFVALVHTSPDERAQFLADYPYDVAATTDDRPFFFQFYRFRSFAQESRGGHVITGLPVGYAVLGASLLQMTLLSALFILGPLWSERSHLREASQRGRRIALFGAAGVGFMGIEVTSLQMFTVFLGAPVYSMAITLASLLVATGLGSLWAGRRGGSADRLVRGAVMAIAIWVFATIVGLQSLLEVTISWPITARAALVALWLLPVGLALGVPLPTAIRALREETPALVPWAWGANACASVLASILVVLVSMQLGFRATLGLMVLVYAVGYWFWRPTVAAETEPAR